VPSARAGAAHLRLAFTLDVGCNLVDREARRLLARLIVDEGFQECGSMERQLTVQIGVLNAPVIVLIGNNVSPF
jgi:hypothetical protein